MTVETDIAVIKSVQLDIKQTLEQHAESLKNHNGYIRDSQMWQSKMEGRFQILTWLLAGTFLATLSLLGGILLEAIKGNI